ncbi:conserved hypothetical protein [Chloroherpeton thalassium ATCC 35110]|uniref:Type IX secretion system protein PorV domain-containing protein n=1 Tax=Chloroherpeton thalassium (strain ATCC 35110 / GB-78) TaxID=517418 RepID=B3QVL6_CHLT3|nr:type IX secretion system outer membrane channel protein PorV [Chloroherpeton thalassium]ACF14616.1 conserved hypothetical protein [Chloroherpeton thalassium ATCC 35110]
MQLLKAPKKILLVVASLLLFNSAHAQNTITTAVPFLLISPDSRANGMGEANVAIADNASAIYWNPAGLGFQKGADVNFTHADWLPAFNADLFYDYLSAKYYMRGYGTFGLGITYLDLGEVNYRDEDNRDLGIFKSYEFALTGAYGVRIHPYLSVGASIRYIYSALTQKNITVGSEEGSGVGSTISFDLATMWRPVFAGYLADRLSFGLNISNIGPKMTYIDEAQADPLPTNLKVGFALRAYDDDYNKLTIAADFNKLLVTRNDDNTTDGVFEAMFSSWSNGLESFTFGVGAEYWYGHPALFALRTGYFYEDPNYGGRKYLTFGAGVRYSSFGVDFSYLSAIEENHPLDGTVRFSVLLNFPKAGI